MFKTEFIEGISKKNGNKYYAIRVFISDDYQKLVFLNPSEVALIKALYYNK